MSKKPNILLVHGAWADGSSWGKVISLLTEAGYNIVATQQKLVSLEDDAETVRRAAESLDGPVLLVGHSYGGAVITEAAHLCPNVIGLVYIAGFALDKGESLEILSASGPVAPPGAAAIRPDKYGFLWIDREMFADNFCQDVDKTEAHVMAVVQKPLSLTAFQGKITDAGWKNLPCWYQVSMNDRMIPPPAEQFMATRINARTITIPASHASMVSHPENISEFILGAAKELHASFADEAAVHGLLE
ncbi:MAG TPA: alpha/beta hydrolase [Puia sp.]|jgi:pimeloyl-ACP methyl ester carboxylesterase|nr:alpha/beta hydrolase [Puia sp.]